ncbi:uncharacterized protein (UPF0303 family) [Rhizobium pisi]
MSLSDIDLHALVAEEQELVFSHFDSDVAWRVGCLIRDRAQQEKLPIAIELSICSKPIFFSSMTGATPDNAEWIRRKRNVVDRFHRNSLYFAAQEAQQGRPFIERFSLCGSDFSAKGGGVPILLRGIGAIGALVISGLPHEQDHQLVIEVLRECTAGPVLPTT